MKFKLLVNGNNLTLVKDFFGYTGQYFYCLSTTDVIKDMTAHFELFNPDAFLCFIDSAYDGTVEQILRLRTCPEYNSAPIVIVSKEETIEELGVIPNGFLMKDGSYEDIIPHYIAL